MAIICIGDFGICAFNPDIMARPGQFSYRIIIWPVGCINAEFIPVRDAESSYNIRSAITFIQHKYICPCPAGQGISAVCAARQDIDIIVIINQSHLMASIYSGFQRDV